MALTKDKKKDVIKKVEDLLSSSKMTVVAKYEGTSVKAMQELRRSGSETGTTLTVIKNRLVIKAIKSKDNLKNVDTANLNGMLLYAFNPEDEVAPAQTIANFAKKQPTLEFVCAITGDGKLLSKDEVKALAMLPSKEELIAQVMATLSSPANDVMSGLAGNLHGLLDGLAAKISQ